jgi:ABC-2 type transport system permease protein
MGKQITIARHEIRVRFLSKLIAFNLLILLAVVSITPWIPKIINSQNPTSIGIYAAASVKGNEINLLKESLQATAMSQGFTLNFVNGRSLSELKNRKRDRKLPIILGVKQSNYTIISLEKGNHRLLAFLTNYSQVLASNEYIVRNGLNPGEYQQFVNKHRASVISLLGKSDNLTDEQYFASMILNLLLFTLIVLASSHLVMGVVEEKSSHVMEIILYAVKPRQLLIGKLTGISAFIFLQFILLIVAGYISACYAGIAGKAHLTLSSAFTVFLWFPPAFLFFAITYSAVGARTSRIEDLGAVQAPLMILVSASLYASIFAINAPDAQWVKVLSYLPPFSFFLESSRTLLGVSNGGEEFVSWTIAIFVTFFVGVLGIRSFEKRVFLSK